MSDTAISTRGLRKTYGDLAAVDGLDLEIMRGEVFALLGPNGAGKSTTVEIMEGFRARSSGEVSVLGVDPAHADRAWRERIGIMLQSTPEQGFLTAREALTHASRLYPRPRDVEETLATIGLMDKANAKPQKLSGGQRRRLEVGLAIIGNPELVFLDEPTTGFDPEARRQFWDTIAALRGQGTTILLTTHYLDEAEFLADRIGIIAAGRRVALDTPAGLRQRSREATVRWRENGTTHEVSTAEPTRVVREVLARMDGEVEGLAVTHPTLEDIYLGLIADATRTAAPDAPAAPTAAKETLA